MSYMIIKVYSFECDHPGCENFTDCAGPQLRDALKELRYSPGGWTIRGTGAARRIFCPDHKPEVAREKAGAGK